MGLHPSAISKAIAGKRRLSSSEIARAAEYFETDVPGVDVTAVADPQLVSAKVAGTVEAGSFREVDEFDQREPETFLIPRDPEFPRARVLAFDVAGDSMNALKPLPIPPGYRAICVAYEDISDRVPLRSGMVVVVQRTRDGGHIREWSIKQVEFYADRIEFHPRSTNPKHKPIVVPHDYQADDGTTVEVIALVRSGIIQFGY